MLAIISEFLKIFVVCLLVDTIATENIKYLLIKMKGKKLEIRILLALIVIFRSLNLTLELIKMFRAIKQRVIYDRHPQLGNRLSKNKYKI